MKYILTTLVALLIFGGSGLAQEKKERETNDKKKMKSYDEVITDKAISDEGLFTVHEIEGTYYYEIPMDMFQKDMLLVSRISKIPNGLGGGYMNAGRKTNEQIIRWSRFKNDVHLKTVSYANVADKNLPIYESVQDNNYQPVLAAFKIEAFGKDSTTVVIKVDDLFTTDVKALSPISSRIKESYKVSSLDKKRSYIDNISSFPQNVEVRHDMTYNAAKPPSNAQTATLSIQMRQSMYLLPEEPMQARLFDPRVGWFTTTQIDYGSQELKADEKKYIKRWKMIPSDVDAYDRGELVDPVKPIVYYLDPATPEQWIPYFKQGILDWNEAFEAAGFKNAVQVRDAPSTEEDPDWSPEDARYSTVRYVASTTRNAMGPSVADPRSGEIIESDIIWYHNHLRSYRNRYMLETGAANPSARTLHTSEAEIGEMMRRVISHEVGHALGLPHNMKASYAYPTDSLRSASFTQKWGLATTIMDYTRYNYVAQPGDEGVRWVRMLGPYDIYSIDWGYRYISNARSAAAEVPTLDKWIKAKNGDPMFLFGARNSFDPSSQTECVGDDTVLASTYGLKNLKIVAANLDEWTETEGKGFEDLSELYGELISVWNRYVGHVVTNVGGVYEIIKTAPEDGYSYTHLAKNQQQNSVQFLLNEAFTTPTWMLPADIVRNIGPSGIITKVGDMQNRQMGYLLRKDRLMRMIENQALNGSAAYSLNDLFQDLRQGLFEVNNPDVYQRNLQRFYTLSLLKLITEDGGKTDISAVARGELQWIENKGKKAAKRNRTDIQSLHLAELYHLVEEPPVMMKKKSADGFFDAVDSCCEGRSCQ